MKTILAFGAHPDDVELSAGGTLARMGAAGHRTVVVDLTCGELGTRGSGAIRRAEAKEAAKILGLAEREQLGLADGFFELGEGELRTVVAAIRKFRPEVVLANALSDRHPDHGRAAELVSRAFFLSGLSRVETPGLEAWRPQALYHYIQDHHRQPDLVVDITGFEEVKERAILAYASQFNRAPGDGPSTAISEPGFLDHIRGRQVGMGRSAGFTAGEGFETERPVGVQDLFHLF